MARRQEGWRHLLRELQAEFLQREEELELLHTIDVRLLGQELDLDETLAFVTNGTRAQLGSAHVSILLKRGPVLDVTYSSDDLAIGKKVTIQGSILGKVLTEQRSVFIPDLGQSPLRQGYGPIADSHGAPVRSLILVPIVLRGDSIGVFCAESPKAAAFRRAKIRVLEAIAAQTAVALENVQHFASAALFADLDEMILSQADSQQVIQRALRRVVDELYTLQQVQLSGAQILFRRGDDQLEIVHSTNPADVGLALSVHGSVPGRAVLEHRTVVVADVRHEMDYVRLGVGIQSEIAVPITLGTDVTIIGVLNVESEVPDAFSGFNRVVLENFADKVRLLLAFVKLRNDVTFALEARHANDLLIAIGDQTSNFIHRLNNSAGALRTRILELQDTIEDDGVPDKAALQAELTELLRLADRTLEMPASVSRFIGQGGGNTFDVNKCITDVLREQSPPANITVTTDLEDSLPQLSLYSFDIVVQNLIRNAIDAMPNGGRLTVTTRLVTHADAPAGYVQLVIRDTGTGIPEDIMPHIFDLNFTTKARKKGKGLGLGLWWVRTFITRSRGEITVESEKNAGTEFSVKIPVATGMGAKAERPHGDR